MTEYIKYSIDHIQYSIISFVSDLIFFRADNSGGVIESATTSKALLRPLEEAFLNPPTLLMVADCPRILRSW